MFYVVEKQLTRIFIKSFFVVYKLVFQKDKRTGSSSWSHILNVQRQLKDYFHKFVRIFFNMFKTFKHATRTDGNL